MLFSQPSRGEPMRYSMPFVAYVGSRKNSPTESTSARIIEIGIITTIIDLPNFFLSHFSNLVSSSSVPSISPDFERVEKESFIISMKFIAPRNMGIFRNLCFFLTETNESFCFSIDPSGLRTAMQTLSPLFIITPSSTA